MSGRGKGGKAKGKSKTRSSRAGLLVPRGTYPQATVILSTGVGVVGYRSRGNGVGYRSRRGLGISPGDRYRRHGTYTLPPYAT